jgi:hypothetical protein
MSASPDRRRFLHTATAATALGLGELPFLSALRPVSAAEARLNPDLVRLRPEIEPLVQLIEETPRNRLLEEIGSRIKKGLSYQELLAALLLAGVRNIQPRPQVGFKFHAVLVVNSAHQASLASPDRERWLPLFWSLDNFKSSQAQNEKEGGWRMKPVDEMKLPPAHKARQAFIDAMDNWDEEGADVAIAALARSAGANELFELFARYGCRDFRSIGHKAIFVANAFRTLQVIGWHHAEPVLRSLAYALLMHEGGNPAKRDADPDRPGRQNAERITRIGDDWLTGQRDPQAAADLLAALRETSASEAAEKVVALLASGVSPRSVWDGLFLAGGELLMRQPGIVALHSLTTLNALHYAYEAAANDDTRRLLLLQGASFLPLFREAMKGRGPIGEAKIDAFEPDETTPGVEAVFDTLSKDKPAAARMALGYLKATPHGGEDLIAAGRRLIFLKGTDSHDYKFSSAVMEDYAFVSTEWRDRFLAASLFWLKGSAGPDAGVVRRTRAALA